MANTIGVYNSDASNDIGVYEAGVVVIPFDPGTGHEGWTETEWWTRRHKLYRTENRRMHRDPIRTNRSDDE